MIWPPQITRRDLVLIAQTLQRPLRLSAMPLGFEARNGSVALWVRSMCNLYSVTKNQAAIRDLFKVGRDTAGNLPPLPAIFPGERELIMTLRAGEDPSASTNAAGGCCHCEVHTLRVKISRIRISRLS
jgi:hypothetical protein